MRKFLTHNDIGPEFLDILFAFGTKPRQSEAGLASMTVKQRPDGSYGVNISLSVRNLTNS